MVQGNGAPSRYSIHSSGYVNSIIKDLHRKAWQAGNGPKFRKALHSIMERLRDDPVGFGEPLYRLPALQVLVFVAVVPPIVIYYGVHDDKPLVFIRGVSEI